MARLMAKTVRGHTYWQIVESRRIYGKPRPIVLAHLGKADDLLRDCGAVAALGDIAQDLGLQAVLHQQTPQRRQGHAVADYLLLAALSRALRPCPKTRLADGYPNTVLPRLLPLPTKHLSSQRFWDHFDYRDADPLQRLEEALSLRLAQRYGLDLKALVDDATNFDTYLDAQTAAHLPQRGHAKSHRADWRIVGLALMVSADFPIPWFWQVHPGNQPESVTFATVLPPRARRHRQLLAGLEQHLTLVFDQGNNAAATLQALAQTPYHLIGALVPSQQEALLAVPLSRFRRLPARFGTAWVHRTRKEVYGRPWTVVLTRSARLLAGQVRGIRQHLRQRLQRLAEWQRQLAASHEEGYRGKPYTCASLDKHLSALTRGQYLSTILWTRVQEHAGRWTLAYGVDDRAFRELRQRVRGKRLLCTDQASWTDEEIVSGYRGQQPGERAFRDRKDPTLVQFRPLFHWTDSKIRVHALCCVLALLGLRHRRVVQSGVEISRTRLLEEWKQVRVVTNLYGGGGAGPRGRGRPRAQTVLSKTSALQKQLCDILELHKHIPH
jgi:transposase